MEEDYIKTLEKLITTKFINDYSIDNKDKEAIETLIARNKKLEKALIDMVNQFAYDDNNPKTQGSSLEKLYTGGLSALENAFNVLDIDEGVRREELWKKK